MAKRPTLEEWGATVTPKEIAEALERLPRGTPMAHPGWKFTGELAPIGQRKAQAKAEHNA